MLMSVAERHRRLVAIERSLREVASLPDITPDDIRQEQLRAITAFHEELWDEMRSWMEIASVMEVGEKRFYLIPESRLEFMIGRLK